MRERYLVGVWVLRERLLRERICHGYIMRFYGYYRLTVRVSLSLFLSLSVLFFLIIILLGFIFFLSDDGVFVH